MNIGSISNMNYAAVMRLNSPAATMRMNSPAMEYARQQKTPNTSPALSALQTAQNISPVPGLSPTIPGINPIGNTPGMMFFSPDGDILELSKHASLSSLEALEPQGICHTCENRRYVDQSDDSSVSFQTPTKVSPSMAGAAVAAHEQEHVRNELANAARENREIVNQSVTLHYDTCPECGKTYVSGGTTRTTSITKSDSDDSTEPEFMSGGETSNEDD